MEINLNDIVLVKLTEFGRQYLREEHDRFWAQHPEAKKIKYVEPKEDKNGYSRFQLWDLISKFGSFCHLPCTNLPFETNILVEK